MKLLLATLVSIPLLASTASSQTICNPVVSLSGAPCQGNVITVRTTANFDCPGCTMWSFDPGPTPIKNISVPLGQPASLLFVSIGTGSLAFTVPSDPALLDTPVYFAAVHTDGARLEASNQLMVNVCP